MSTTFMVSPCHALTSYHSVFGGDVWPDVADYSATITLKNANTGEPFELKAKPVAIGVFNLFEPRKRDDLVLLRTENCPTMSSGVGWFGLGAIKEDQKDLSVNIAAFYERKCGSKFWTQSDCMLRYHHTDHGWSHSCTAKPMSSGGAIFVMSGGFQESLE